MEDYSTSNFEDDGMLSGFFDNIRAARARAAAARMSVAEASARHMAATRTAAGYPGPQKRSFADAVAAGPQKRARGSASAVAQAQATAVAARTAAGAPSAAVSAEVMSVFNRLRQQISSGRSDGVHHDTLEIVRALHAHGATRNNPGLSRYFLQMALKTVNQGDIGMYFVTLAAYFA